MSKIYKIHQDDNVAVELENDGNVKPGHKIALVNIKSGEYVIKYGHIIGIASQDIKAGEWVHSHNLKTHLDTQKNDYEYKPSLEEINYKKGTFLGYKRKNRRAGIRNDIYIIPTVGCVNGVAKSISEISQKYKRGNIDSISYLPHQFGCSQLGQDQTNIETILANIALNPNATYVLFVGLGCENSSIERIKSIIDKKNVNHVKYYNCQNVENEVEYGVEIIKEFIDKAASLEREEVDISELCIGLKCGGSDGYSGITSNPVAGMVSNIIIEHGGSAILTEVPEMFGAEQILMNKCINKTVFSSYCKMINDFKNYYITQGFPVYENPSPGNKEGGITTLEEKSLGCITKAGKYPIVDVLNYGQAITKCGLNVLDGPGNDLIASTSLGASGCQLILFTTGRGTPYSSFVPTIKIASNSLMANKKNNWIDYDASSLDYEKLYDLVLKTASGLYKCKQEENKEIAFFKKGITL